MDTGTQSLILQIRKRQVSLTMNSSYFSQKKKINDDDNELRHYGVLGMKWGEHRAQKKGTKYRYESHEHKRTVKKGERLKSKLKKTYSHSKGVKRSAKQAAKIHDRRQKLKEKLSKNKLLEKQLNARDAGLQKYAHSIDLGEAVVTSVLLGRNFHRMEAANASTGKALVAGALSRGSFASRIVSELLTYRQERQEYGDAH